MSEILRRRNRGACKESVILHAHGVSLVENFSLFLLLMNFCYINPSIPKDVSNCRIPLFLIFSTYRGLSRIHILQYNAIYNNIIVVS